MMDFTARDFGRLEAKVDMILENQKDDRDAVAALAKRTSRLEHRLVFFSGIGSAVGICAGWFAKGHNIG